MHLGGKRPEVGWPLNPPHKLVVEGDVWGCVGIANNAQADKNACSSLAVPKRATWL